MDSMFSIEGLSLTPDEDEGPSLNIDHAGLFAGTVIAPAAYARNGVTYMVCRRWGSTSKQANIERMKAFKRELPPEGVAEVAKEMARLIVAVLGRGVQLTVTGVACGHSRRPDCLSTQLAMGIAQDLEVPYLKVFADRFLSGSSHPMGFKDLPALELIALPERLTLVVDDVATSGFHVWEAVTTLRDRHVPAIGCAWIGGIITT